MHLYTLVLLYQQQPVAGLRRLDCLGPDEWATQGNRPTPRHGREPQDKETEGVAGEGAHGGTERQGAKARVVERVPGQDRLEPGWES